MIKNQFGNTRTANQLAKELLLDQGWIRCQAWGDFVDTAQMTDKEQEDVQRHIEKHTKRIWRLLGKPNPEIPKDFTL